MIYHSAQSDDYLWSLILRGQQKEKTKTHGILSSSILFNYLVQPPRVI